MRSLFVAVALSLFLLLSVASAQPVFTSGPTYCCSSIGEVNQALTSGTYSKVIVGDQVTAHDAELAHVNNIPTVFTGSYYVVPPPNSSLAIKPQSLHVPL